METVPYALSIPKDLEQTVREVEKLDRRVVARQADVRDPAAVAAVVADDVA